MPSPDRVAEAHYRSRRRLVQGLARSAARLWRRVDVADLTRSWARPALEMMALLGEAQRAAAGEADQYLTSILHAQGLDVGDVGEVAVRRLAGIASDGRSLATLLQSPVVVTKLAIGSGVASDRAVAAGAANLDMIVRTQVADAGRVADEVATAARPNAGGYVRMVVGKTCARCLVLAGRWYEWNQGFNRHPRCDCIHIPSAEAVAGDLRTDPRRAFDGMDRAEQDRVFGKAGAEAIREGADIGSVVNARRGMYTTDGKLLTHEATSARGVGRRIRLMPEQIFREANGNRDEALRLLRLHGYLI